MSTIVEREKTVLPFINKKMRTINYENKTYKVFSLDTPYGHEEVICVPREYCDGRTLAIEMISVKGTYHESYAVLTVNLDCYSGRRTQSGTRAYVDTNNNEHWGCLDFIKNNNLGKPLGIQTQSGFCVYPLYEFNVNEFYA